MNKKCVLFVATLFCAALWAGEQIPSPIKPDAALELSRGKAAEKIGDSWAALEHYCNAVILDPDCVECVSTPSQKAITSPWTLSPPESLRSIRAMYQSRSAAAPDNAFYLWAIAVLDDSATRVLAERSYRSTIALKPDFIKAYEGLAATLSFRGDLQGELECLNKLRDMQPGNSDALAAYAQRVLESDPALARKLTTELLQVSHHPAGADLLARLAAFDPNLTTRIETLEQLKAWYPPSENDTTEWHMRFLFDAYNRTDPMKALALAQEMVLLMSPRSEAGRDWQAISKFQARHIQARSLMERKSYGEAIKELKDLKTPYLVSNAPHSILDAEALEKTGKAEEAYQVLIRAMAAQPSDELKTAVNVCGQRRNKSSAQVNADIFAFRTKGAHKAPDFEVYLSNGWKPVKITEYRGQVVLLDFWNPSSVTARDDFPHLKKMLQKYEAKGFTIISINTRPDMPVASVLTNRYSFVPLTYMGRSLDDFKEVPYYLLLDREGRALYEPQFGGYDAQRSFELEVELLLGK